MVKADMVFVPTEVLEERGGTGRMTVRGIFQKVGKKNANNRIYPESVWQKTLTNDSHFMRRLRERKILGELEHPESGNTHLARVSHLITNVTRTGDIIIGEATILRTPNGNILEELFRMKIPVGISSRGSGSTKNVDGCEEVQEDFDLRTFDFVYDPSVEDAYPELVSECKAKLEHKANGTTNKEDVRMDSKAVVDLLRECEKMEERTKQVLASDKISEVVECNTSVNALISRLKEADAPEHKDDFAELRGKFKNYLDSLAAHAKKLEATEVPTKPDDKLAVAAGGAPDAKLPPDEKDLKTVSDPVAANKGKVLTDAEKKAAEAGKVVEKTDPEPVTPEKYAKLEGRLVKAIELGEALIDISAGLTSKAKMEHRARIVAEKKLTNATKLLETIVSRYRSEKLEALLADEIAKTPELKKMESVIRTRSKTVSEAKQLIEAFKASLKKEAVVAPAAATPPAAKPEEKKESKTDDKKEVKTEDKKETKTEEVKVTGVVKDPLPPVGGPANGGKETVTEKAKDEKPVVSESQGFIDRVISNRVR